MLRVSRAAAIPKQEQLAARTQASFQQVEGRSEGCV
jgi:hypothetical protein